MKKKGVLLPLFVLLALAIFVLVEAHSRVLTLAQEGEGSTEDFLGGDGTEGNPFLISEPRHLDNVRKYLGPAYANTYFKLVNDLDMGDYLANHPDFAENGWLAIGNYNGGVTSTFLNSTTYQNNAFHGVFDGDGHTIRGIWGYYPITETKNLNSNTQWIAAGLFGLTGTTSIIKNVTVITDNRIYLRSTSLVAPEFYAGFVGGVSVGGIVGSSLGKVFNCKFVGNLAIWLSAYFSSMSLYDVGGGIGGIAGAAAKEGNKTYRAELIGNTAYANIYVYKANTSSSYSLHAGGILGFLDLGTISNNVFRGSIRSTDPGMSVIAGGIVGETEGGLRGEGFEMIMDYNYASGSIYLHSSISRNIKAGGIVGRHGGINSYAKCNYSEMALAGMSPGTTTINGFGDYSAGELNYNYFNSEIAGTTASGLGSSTTGTNKAVAITTAQSKLQSTFTGFDFENIWRMEEGSSPTLRIEPAGVTFTESYGVSGMVTGVGADTQVTLTLENSAGVKLMQTITGNSKFAFEDLENGTYVLSATAPGYTVFSRILFVNNCSVNQDVRLFPENRFNVSGRILGANYENDIFLEFKSKMSGQTFNLTVSGSSYEISLPAGEYSLKVQNEGTSGYTGELAVLGDTLFDIELQKVKEGVTVSGTVSGAEGSAVTVSLYRADTDTLVQSAVVTANFAFNYVESGTYYIKAECPGYISEANVYLLYVVDQNLTQNISFSPFKQHQISGSAYAGEKELRLLVLLNGAVYKEAVLPGGAYTINLPAGTYQLVFSAEGYKTLTLSGVEVDADTILPDVNLLPAANVFTVSGSILGLNGTGRANIYLENVLTGETYSLLYCNNVYKFINIPSGDYVLRGDCPGYVSQESEITVAGSDVFRDIVFEKIRLLVLSGTVSAGDREVLVQVMYQGIFIKEMSADTGAFSFELPAGIYTLVFSADGYLPKSLYDIEIGEEDVNLGDVELAPVKQTYSLSGNIEGNNGTLVYISLYNKATGELLKTVQTVSAYAFTMLEAGEYILEPAAAGYGFERNAYFVTITDADVTLDLVAIEGAVVYLITYHNLEGAYYNNPQYYNQFTPTFTLNDPVKEGYEFLGWFLDEGLTVPANTTVEQGTTGNLEFYASWRIKEYTITYVLNGGVNNPENPSRFTYFEEVILLPADLKGAKFAGWYDNPEFKGSPVTAIPVKTDTDIVLYARFNPIQVLTLKPESNLVIKKAEGTATTIVDHTHYDPNVPLYLMGVYPNLKVGELKEMFENANVVVEKGGKSLADSANVGTDYEVKLYDEEGNLLDKLTVVLIGDTTGDGVINALDLNRISNYLKGSLTLEGAFLLAADTLNDGRINVMDVTRLNLHINGKNRLYN